MRYALILSLVALPAVAQDTGSPDTEAEPPVGGVGRLACNAIIGPENAAYLAQTGDWALGYMAGRLDAGDELAEGATLSPEDSVDVVAGIAVRCREDPDQAVIEAVRGFAEGVFGAEAQAGPVTADAPPPPPDVPETAEAADPPRETVAPEPRPRTAAPAAPSPAASSRGSTWPGSSSGGSSSPAEAASGTGTSDTAATGDTSADSDGDTSEQSARSGASPAADAAESGD